MNRFNLLVLTYCFMMVSSFSIFAQEEPLPLDSLMFSKPMLKNRFLCLEKGGVIKRVKYKTGDRINFYLKNDPSRTLYRPFIQGITPTGFVSYNTEIKLDQIGSVVIFNDHWFVDQGSVYFPIAGAGYFLMDMVNPLFSKNEAFVISKPAILTSSVLILGGLALKLFKKKKHQLNQRKYLKIIDKY